MDNQLIFSGNDPERVSQTYCQTIELLSRFVCVLAAIAVGILGIEKPARGEHAG